MILECDRDTKKLYKVINGITSNNMANPMPDTTDDKQLTEEFAEFYMGKIKEIHKTLDSHLSMSLGTSQCTAKYENLEG